MDNTGFNIFFSAFVLVAPIYRNYLNFEQNLVKFEQKYCQIRKKRKPAAIIPYGGWSDRTEILEFLTLDNTIVLKTKRPGPR